MLSHDFEVVEEWGFSDRDTKEHRSLDIYAFRALPAGDGLTPRLHLLIECKRSDLPYVFFRPGVQKVPVQFPPILGLPHFEFELDGNRFREVSAAEFFGVSEFPFAAKDPSHAVTFSRAERKGKGYELSGEVPFNKVMLPLASAVQHFRAVFNGKSDSPLIVIPVCVLDAPMVVASGTPETPVLRAEPWVRVAHQEVVDGPSRWRWEHYTGDFVHRGFLNSYLRNHAMPFAEGVSARLRAFRAALPDKASFRRRPQAWESFVATWK